jgi:hypothetical protein
VESQQLLTQSEILEDEIFASTKDAAKPAEEVPEPHDHGKNLIRRCQTNSWATHMIVQVYDVLMNDSSRNTCGRLSHSLRIINQKIVRCR